MAKKDISKLRVEYQSLPLNKGDLDSSPIQQLRQWVEAAINAEEPEPNAMTLATATPDGLPYARIVLLKQLTDQGLIFYTNYNSDKAQEILKNPHVAVVFNWLNLHRQVRITGEVVKVEESVSDNYFAERPRKSQLGAWSSPQSRIIKNRKILEDRLASQSEKWPEDQPIKRPPHWGGFLIIPDSIEFWQGRRSRLHDRLKYVQLEDDSWVIVRLAP